jgi:hypothetical protein
MRFQFPVMASMKMTAFCDVTPMIEAVGIFETSINFYDTTRCSSLEYSHFQLDRETNITFAHQVLMWTPIPNLIEIHSVGYILL